MTDLSSLISRVEKATGPNYALEVDIFKFFNPDYRDYVEGRGGLVHKNDGEDQRALDAEVARLPELCAGLWGAEAYRSAIRVPHGLPTGVDEAARVALGNAVLPVIPQAIGRAILTLENPAITTIGGDHG